VIEVAVQGGERGAHALRRGLERFARQGRCAPFELRCLHAQLLFERRDEGAFVGVWARAEGVEPKSNLMTRMKRSRYKAGVQTSGNLGSDDAGG